MAAACRRRGLIPGCSEEVMSQAVFVYGSLLNLDDLREMLGRKADPDVDYVRARIVGHRRVWNVATDNQRADGSIQYFAPNARGLEPIQVLFPNIEPARGETVEGLLVITDDPMLRRADDREGNYRRVEVTDAIAAADWPMSGRPDVIWGYVGKAEAMSRARAGIAAGSARIRQQYLDRMRRGMSSHGRELKAAFEAESLPDVPVVPLDRRIRK